MNTFSDLFPYYYWIYPLHKIIKKTKNNINDVTLLFINYSHNEVVESKNKTAALKAEKSILNNDPIFKMF